MSVISYNCEEGGHLMINLPHFKGKGLPQGSLGGPQNVANIPIKLRGKWLKIIKFLIQTHGQD